MNAMAWLTPGNFIAYTKVSDSRINAMLQDIRKIDPNYFLEEKLIRQRKWFKTISIAKYRLFYRRQGYECEVLTFVSDPGSFGFISEKEIIIFLSALFCGLK